MPREKTKGMCIATRCTSVDQFVQMFSRFVDEESFFISTHNTRPPGLETAFSVQLADGTPVLRGLCVVLQAWTNASNPFKTPGVRLGIMRLTANSMPVFERLLVTRAAPTPPPIAKPTATPPPIPKPPALPERRDDTAVTKAMPQKLRDAVKAEPETETRTPGSDLVLPANPLMNLTDASLDGFIDCTLYEETGNFFPADDDDASLLDTDDVVPPPELAPRPALARATPPPMPIVSAPIEMSALMRLSGPMQIVTPPTSTAAETPVPEAERFAIPSLASTASVRALPSPRETPIPAGEVRPDLEPAARRIRVQPWIVGAGAGAVAVAILVVVLATKHAAKPAPAKQPEVVAQMQAKPVVREPVVAEPTPPPPPPADPVVEPATDGPPVVGEGPCRLAVATTPAGSMITLDGKTLAPSPLTIATSCDRHTVAVDHPRYKPATRAVVLAAGETKSLDVTLDRPTHKVQVTSAPSGATIYIDGRPAGTTPTMLTVMGFQQVKLELKKPGYAPQTTKLYSKVANDKVAVRLARAGR